MREQIDDFLRRRGSQLLMWVLIALILVSPMADVHRRAGAVMAIIVLFSVLLGASFSGNRRIVVLVAIPVAAVWVIARLLEEFGDGKHVYDHMAHAAGLVLSCTMLWAIFDRISTTVQVTSNVIAEAVISYLIIGIAFSQLYWILNELFGDPFNQQIPASQSSTFLYFSLVTLTSVGYGGLTPINPYVRLVATFESMTGIFYMAVVVARLVAAYRPR
jgi:Ion channel